MENQPSNEQQDDGPGWIEPGQKNVQLVYILYLVSLAMGFTLIVGMVFAYMNRDKTEGWIETHYTYAIRTFWMGVLYSIICSILVFVGIGLILMFVAVVWFVIRCIKGLQAVVRGEPIDNPQTWLV